MVTSDKRISIIKTYTISNDALLQFIAKIPTLQQNNKSPEYLMPAQTKDDVITIHSNATTPDKGTYINIRFSYDFVQDRWFLNDKRVDIIDAE